MIKIQVDSDMPIYLQIYWQVVEAISSGLLKEGTKLPSSRKLASDLSINYHTVNKAYELLIEKNFVHRNEKRQTIVGRGAENNNEFITEWLNDQELLISEARATGLTSQAIKRLIESLLDKAAETP